MTIKLWLGTLGLMSLGLTANGMFATTARAESASSLQSLEEIERYNQFSLIPGVTAQVTSVSQLTDVKPTDWAFQALQSLVERYGCIAGYPDRTFRGNRALTRYEFAAGLNACLEKVNELIASATDNLAKKEDLETVQKLQEGFAVELDTLRGRVNAIEAKVEKIDKQQFSTTTKLSGEAIINVAGVLGDDRALNSDQWRTINAAATPAARNTALNNAFGAAGRNLQDNTIVSDRVRLDLRTSFTGKDLLLTRLEANNTTAFNSPITGTNMTRLGFDATANLDNSVQLGKVFYRFPAGKKLNLVVDAIGGEFYDNLNTFNPLFSSGGTGAVSRFGRFSPIYRASNTGSAGNTGSGLTAIYNLSDKLTFSAGYLARRGNDPTDKRGLFDGSYGAIAQLGFQPTKDLGVAFTYAHSYFSGANNDVAISGAYGSGFANQPFGAGAGNTATNPTGIATSANSFGIQANYRIAPQAALSGWVNYTKAIAENGFGTNVRRGDNADIWNWSVALGFPDLGGKGNLGGIIFGQPPKVTRSSFGPTVATATSPRREDDDTSLHLELLYRYQLNDKVSITPSFITIFNPEHNSNNDTIYVGALRTTFRF
ncbi:MAG: hypothetical protein RLZZ511_3350 [Cyanobacteriota bacterium]|jgi:hypothetical protein